MNSSVLIHQALHGYSDGHELLASSTRLSAAAQRRTLVLSDLSGPLPPSAFEPYLTAYPLTDDGWFVLSRTWPAPDVRRPGAVWTHSLLIPLHEVGSLQDVAGLTEHFKRPSLDMSLAGFKQPINLSPERVSRLRPRHELPRALAREILTKVYLHPDRPAVVQAKAAAEIDEIVLRVWEQQWPSLRALFTFCTGALSPRRLGDAPFDLQAAPPASVSRLRRNLAEPTTRNQAGADDEPNWLPDAIDGLVGTSDTLPAFFRAIGEDLPGARSAYQLVARGFEIMEHPGRTSGGPLSAYVGDLAGAFPSSSLARHLKKGALRCSPDTEVEQTILRTLLSVPASAFDRQDLDVASRAEGLARVAAAADLLPLVRAADQAPESPYADEILRGVAGGLPARTFDQVARMDEQLGAVVLLREPDLIGNAGLWRTDRALALSLLEELHGEELPQGTVEAILETAVQSELARDSIEQTLSALPEGAGLTALRLLSGSPALRASESTMPWFEVIASSEDVVAWIASAESSDVDLGGAVSMIRPRELQTLRRDLVDRSVLTETRVDLNTWPAAIQRRIACLVYLAALDPLFGSPVGPVRQTFQLLYDAIRSDAIDRECWMALSRRLPRLPRASSLGRRLRRFWNATTRGLAEPERRAYRLHLSLVQTAHTQAWPMEYFLDCYRSEPALAEALRLLPGSKQGREFARALTDAAPALSGWRGDAVRATLA